MWETPRRMNNPRREDPGRRVVEVEPWVGRGGGGERPDGGNSSCCYMVLWIIP